MKHSIVKIVKILFLFSIVYVLALFLLHIFSSFSQKEAYSAVFLTNGQVYFGHINTIDSNTIVLSNVYYFRTDTNTKSTLTQEKKNIDLHVSLIKLGNEIHEPKDTMFINRQQVLFWEELRSDGKLVEALRKHTSL